MGLAQKRSSEEVGLAESGLAQEDSSEERWVKELS